MLGKLIKYEMKGSFRELLPLYAAIIGISALIRPMYMQNLGDAWVGITITVYAALLVAMFVISFLTVVRRFERTMLGPEGYLMHTLPVSASTHILSKLAVAFVIYLLSIIVSTLSFVVIAADNQFFRVFGEFWRYAMEALVAMFHQYTSFVLFELLYLTIFCALCGILLLYLALCIGHLFNRYRSFISVIVYVLSLSVIGRVGAFVSHLFDGWGLFGDEVIYNSAFGFYYNVYDLFAIPEMITQTLIALGLFFAVKYILENKLNLE